MEAQQAPKAFRSQPMRGPTPRRSEEFEPRFQRPNARAAAGALGPFQCEVDLLDTGWSPLPFPTLTSPPPLVSALQRRSVEGQASQARAHRGVAMATMAAFLAALLLSAPAVPAEGPSDVVTLDGSNFDDYVGTDKAAFVEFYAPW